MSIAILCPTYGRPKQFKRMVDSVKHTAHNRTNIRIYAAFTHDDITRPEYDCTGIKEYCWPDYPTGYKWNKLALNANHDLYMLAADDMVFTTPHWDEALLSHYRALKNKIHVYHLRDSRDPSGTPHPIVTKEYIKAMGYFVPPVFLHWYADSWTVDMAKSNKCFTHLADYELQHIKPSDKGNPDETHSRIRRNGWHERDTFAEHSCRAFLAHEKTKLATILALSEAS